MGDALLAMADGGELKRAFCELYFFLQQLHRLVEMVDGAILLPSASGSSRIIERKFFQSATGSLEDFSLLATTESRVLPDREPSGSLLRRCASDGVRRTGAAEVRTD